MLEVACKKSSKILVVLLSAADTPVLKLGKIVFSCTLEVIKGQMICFDQKYVSRSDVSHFPLEALEATSKSATFPFLPSAPTTSDGCSDSGCCVSLGPGGRVMRSGTASPPTVDIYSTSEK